MSVPDRRRLWLLLAHDPQLGLATTVVGVAGVEGTDAAVSWLPLTYLAAEPWRQRLAVSGGNPRHLADVLLAVHDDANGLTLDVLEISPPPPAADLRGAVEAVIDELLATAGGR